MPRLTRKKGKSVKYKKQRGGSETHTPKTIPELRKAFEDIDHKVKTILDSGKGQINEKAISEFKKVWKTKFGKALTDKEAESYLELQVSANKKSHGGTRKNRKQHGGVGPVDYTLRPGIDGTHGSYLPYVSSGLSFYNDINKIAMDADCGKIDTTPQVSIGMGSNEVMKGGQLSGARYISPTVPPSILQDAQDYSVGNPIGPSSSVFDIGNRTKSIALA
jgi:hypothetical protein